MKASEFYQLSNKNPGSLLKQVMIEPVLNAEMVACGISAFVGRVSRYPPKLSRSGETTAEGTESSQSAIEPCYDSASWLAAGCAHLDYPWPALAHKNGKRASPARLVSASEPLLKAPTLAGVKGQGFRNKHLLQP